MKYAIIAAGEGSRLALEGIREPKPLVRIGGESLIDRLIRIFLDNDAEEIVCICNDNFQDVVNHLSALQHNGLDGRRVPLRYVVKSTPSSMHSLYAISSYLCDGPFILTTVDTIFSETEFAAYVAQFRQSDADGLMGVTDYIDDERPLYVQTNSELEITAFLDQAVDCPYISAGIYGLHPEVLTTLRQCIDRGEQRMRNFQRALLKSHARLVAWPFTKVLDVDHMADIAKAELFLRTQQQL